MMNEKDIKAKYISNQLLNSTNPNLNGLGFHLPLVGFHELVRQYLALPNEIKDLAGQQIIDSLKSLSEGSKVAGFIQNGQIVDKELKEFSTTCLLFKELASEYTLKKMSYILYNMDFFKGIIRTLKRLMNDEIPLNSYYLLFDELITLLIEFIYQRGHSKNSLFALMTNIESQNKHNSLLSTENILNFLMKEVSANFSTYKELKVNVSIDFSASINEKNLIFFIEEYLNGLKKENRIANLISNESDNILELNFDFFQIDSDYTEKMLSNFLEYCSLIEKQFNSLSGKIKLQVDKKEFVKNEYFLQGNMNLKFLKSFLLTEDYRKQSNLTQIEILKILEWTSLPAQIENKKFAFMSLWSVMEFLLIDSTDQNKINTVVENFKGYMSLFYYRKSLKIFYKDIIFKMEGTPAVSQDKFEKFLDQKIEPVLKKEQIKEPLTLPEKFSVFLFSKDINKQNRWKDLNDKNISEEFLMSKTIVLTTDIKKNITRFEEMITSDIKQIYRLRNMLTHSGINDDKILENTFYRLKYYVQTLINAISYSWINNKEITSIVELHNLKKFDVNRYKENFKKPPQNVKDCINLIDFHDALVKYSSTSFKKKE